MTARQEYERYIRRSLPIIVVGSALNILLIMAEFIIDFSQSAQVALTLVLLFNLWVIFARTMGLQRRWKAYEGSDS